ncbi:MAG: response regulator [Myxococcaceae bacterium]|nr:response regulator [Myxococcaceae bacterium]
MATRAGTSVLLIEDDVDLRETERLLLDDAGYDVVTAADGAEALRRVEEAPPDVILLDMRMPVMDGWTFARELHARYGDRFPLVVVTAAEDARARAREVGARDVLGKPFDIDDLLLTVEQNATAH